MEDCRGFRRCMKVGCEINAKPGIQQGRQLNQGNFQPLGKPVGIFPADLRTLDK